MTGQVLRELTRFVACGSICRYKLEKKMRECLQWDEIWRNFAIDLRFTHKLVRVSFLFHIAF